MINLSWTLFLCWHSLSRKLATLKFVPLGLHSEFCSFTFLPLRYIMCKQRLIRAECTGHNCLNQTLCSLHSFRVPKSSQYQKESGFDIAAAFNLVTASISYRYTIHSLLLIRPVLLPITWICRILLWNLDCHILEFLPSVFCWSILWVQQDFTALISANLIFLSESIACEMLQDWKASISTWNVIWEKYW